MAPSVLVIGAGPAGLATALRLGASGIRTTLIDQASHVGGRLLGIPAIVFGWQTATHTLLNQFATSSLAPPPIPLTVEFAGKTLSRLPRLLLPGPLHSLGGLACFSGLSWKDRWRALSLIERTWEENPPLPQHLAHYTADAWLTEHGQSAEGRQRVWAPMARVLCGNDLPDLSAAVLVHILRQWLLSRRRHSEVSIPASDMDSLICSPAMRQLEQYGVTVQLESQASVLEFSSTRVVALHLQDGHTMSADWYITAIPHHQLSSLLPDRMLTHYSYFEQLTRLTDSSSVTVHFQTTRAANRSRLVMLTDSTFHWIVCKAPTKPETLSFNVSLVACDNPRLFALSDHDIETAALQDLNRAIPELAESEVTTSLVLRTPRAFLSLAPGTSMLRPIASGPISNLLLAGDWTDTGLPTCLEGAIRSGLRCADVIEQREQ